MNKAQFGSISSSDLIDAKLEEHQLRGSKRCPSCSRELEGKPNWVGLPAGVKFDPTDQELIDHLEAKVEAKGSKSHPSIDEFIPTIEGDDGICYTHPEKLPGVTRDGLSKHFFHRPSKAYTTGTRKRRKIQTECDFQGSETRWHKTGKTRPVMVAGTQKGCKKILVLYTNFGKNRKPEKTNWVMHQYHLGKNEEEREGELVVSKIFYQTQPRQCNWAEKGGAATGDGGGRGESFSYKEVVRKRDEMCGGVDSNIGGAISNYGGMGFEQLRTENFGFAPPRKNFDEVNEAVVSEPSTLREASAAAGTCEERDMHEHQRPDHVTHIEHQHQQQQHLVQQPHQVATSAAAFHNISMPSNPISTIISPSPLHHTTIILDEDNSFHISRVMLQNENFQQQQHHKMAGGRSASGLEELIMSYTSTDHIKDESSIRNSQDPEWLKYTFWPDPDIPNHHG